LLEVGERTSIAGPLSPALAVQYVWDCGRYLIDKKKNNNISNKSLNILKLLVALYNEG